MQIHAMAIDLPVVHGHPNRVPFYGVLTFLDTPSDAAPSGSRGHRVQITQKAAVDALPSLLGMGVNFATGWDTHNAKSKCGLITAAEIVENELRVEGHIYGYDCPEVEIHAGKNKLGMSYELQDAHVLDLRAPVYTIHKLTFTGAAILLAEKAAYKSTSFNIGVRPENGQGIVCQKA